MYIAHYFLSDELQASELLPWLTEQMGLHGSKPEAFRLVLWVNSSGGDVMPALAASTLIKSSPVPVVTIINGAAESAALLLSMSGHKRYVTRGSWAMAHHFASGVEGTYHEIADFVRHNELLHNKMRDAYIQNTNLTPATVESFFLGRGDRWISDEDLLTLGLVDGILEPGDDILSVITDGAKTSFKKEGKV